ncbi:DNA ligase/mRNA capping enzyme [Schizophyllum commune Tattone D]|nr:DNA ligase/mRNA capping enzyme [Schizophyllum commune Tattone D]
MSRCMRAIPFSFFTSLITAISAIKHFQAGYKGTVPFYALDKLKTWRHYFLAHFPSPPPHTTRIIFCLLFPELDTYRKYHLKEAKLAQAVVQAVSSSHTCLNDWKESGSSGCLGREITEALELKSTNLEEASRLTVHDIDDLLDELASLSPNSDASIHTKYPRDMRRTRQEILSALFRRLNPSDAGILAQIILKDLVPLLYPVRLSGYGEELRDYNTKSVKRLRVEDAMGVWDPSGHLRRLYRTHSDIRYATEAFERGEEEYKPQVGTRIKIPKSLKLQGIKNAFNTFSIRSSRVWVETKYDGERAQIHVQVETDGTSTITIFSKSGRNSTFDRIAVHWIVRQALGLRDPEAGYPGRDDCKVKKNVVLDAEMVAWDTDHIDEFWRIRSLVERTATGVRRRWRPSGAKERKADQSPHAGYSQSSLISDCDEDMTDDTHLALVFFDIMVLNDESLLGKPYSYRRFLLESVVEPIPHYCLFSERYPVDLPRLPLVFSQEDSDSDDDDAPENRRSSIPMDIAAQRALERLYRMFARHLVDRREGIMIKADESRYDDWSLQWAKLKRDYIPGYGDTLDLVLVGAVWDAKRARELGVSPAVYTTFYIGALTNAEALKKDPSVNPHYHVYFVSSYGLTRRQLEDLNSRIKARPTVLFADLTLVRPKDLAHPELEYTFRLFEGLTKPHLVFCEPMLAEVFGAGFDVARGSKHYELRFPRISKIYNIEDRPHTACTTLHELADLAYAVVGRQSTKDEIDDTPAPFTMIWLEIMTSPLRDTETS